MQMHGDFLSILFVVGIYLIAASKAPPSMEYLTSLGLNTFEYPDDDFSHILGATSDSAGMQQIQPMLQLHVQFDLLRYFLLDHTPSKLQQICRLRMLDVNKFKEPLDVQGCGIDRNQYISADDYLEEIEDFDATYGKPLMYTPYNNVSIHYHVYS
jgi:hypothetical protein